jgi:hypothetical protein
MMNRPSTSKIFLPARAASWTPEDLRVLRELVGQGCSAQLIAKKLRRTESSVRNKVVMQGLSLIVRPAQVEPIAPDSPLPRVREANVLGPDS